MAMPVTNGKAANRMLASTPGTDELHSSHLPTRRAPIRRDPDGTPPEIGSRSATGLVSAASAHPCLIERQPRCWPRHPPRARMGDLRGQAGCRRHGLMSLGRCRKVRVHCGVG